MNNKMKKILLKSLLFSAPIAVSLTSINLFKNSTLFMPDEYKLVKKIVNRLANKNDLGKREIAFTITTGGVASYYAKDVGLCKRDSKESCAYYKFLNPFKKYPDPTINEIIRLSYLSGSGSASASSLGTIAIDRNYFRIMDGKENLMVCTIGHELAHILNLDTSNDSLRLNEESKGLNNDKRDELSARISRETEENADLYSQEMVIKAGYPEDTCIKKMEHTMNIRHMPKVTKLDTHPTIPERLSALKGAVNTNQEKRYEEVEKTRIVWEFDRDLNILKFIPIKSKKD